MSRITHANVVQHGGATLNGLALAIVSSFFGATNDATANGITGRKGDYVALRIDQPPTNAAHFMAIGAQMVPGDPNRNPWETFISRTEESPSPLAPPGVAQSDGAYTGLYAAPAAGGHGAWPTYDPHGAPVWLIARLTRDVTNAHLHLMRNLH